jgi:DUF4097 and DUF4098 domain-containing protein YvlB
MRTSLFRFFSVAVIGTALLAFTAANSVAKVREIIDETIPFSSGGTFHIENVNGSITIETWDREEVRIQAEKIADSQASLDDIDVEIKGSGTDVSVITHYPRNNRRGESRQVEYNITLPVDANLDMRTVNGKLEAHGIRGRVDASTTNGGVDVVDIIGETVISTTNGSIRARYTEVFHGEYNFSTTNGSVTLDLPSGAGGELDAKTVNGSITTDFPATVKRLNRRHLRGTFGGGGASFKVSTVNGSVKIRENY